jgi:hypothetical protein
MVNYKNYPILLYKDRKNKLCYKILENLETIMLPNCNSTDYIKIAKLEECCSIKSGDNIIIKEDSLNGLIHTVIEIGLVSCLSSDGEHESNNLYTNCLKVDIIENFGLDLENYLIHEINNNIILVKNSSNDYTELKVNSFVCCKNTPNVLLGKVKEIVKDKELLGVQLALNGVITTDKSFLSYYRMNDCMLYDFQTNVVNNKLEIKSSSATTTEINNTVEMTFKEAIKFSEETGKSIVPIHYMSEDYQYYVQDNKLMNQIRTSKPTEAKYNYHRGKNELWQEYTGKYEQYSNIEKRELKRLKELTNKYGEMISEIEEWKKLNKKYNFVK